MDNKFTHVFLNFLHSCGNKGVWMQPLNHGMTRQVFYHCANTAGKEVNRCFLYFLHPSVNTCVWTQSLNLGMMKVFYHCAPTAGQQVNLCFPLFSPFTCHQWCLDSNPSTLGWRGKCFTTVLTQLARKFFYSHFLQPCVISGVSWTQTLNHQMMWLVFYHCATTAGHQGNPLLIPIFSSIVSSVVSAGLKPSTIRWCGWCFTTVLPLLAR